MERDDKRTTKHKNKAREEAWRSEPLSSSRCCQAEKELTLVEKEGSRAGWEGKIVKSEYSLPAIQLLPAISAPGPSSA